MILGSVFPSVLGYRTFGRRGRVGLVVLVVTAGSAGAMGAAGPVASADAAEGFPLFDARLEAGLPREAVRKAAGAVSVKVPDELAVMVPGLRVDRDAILGTVGYVGSAWAPLTRGTVMAGGVRPSARGVLEAFVHEHAEFVGFDVGDLRRARVAREYTTESIGVTHLTIQEQIDGADLFGCELRASVTGVGALVNLSSTILPLDERTIGEIPPARAGELEALLIAMMNLGITPTDVPERVGETGILPGEIEWRSPDLRPEEPTSTRRVYFPLTRTEIHPAWLVVVPVKGEGHTYEMVIDGVDGSLLRMSDRLVHDSTLPATYRVFTGPSPAPLLPGRDAPDAFQPTLVARELVTILPGEITPFSPDGWIPDSGTTTLGNNVDAHLDVNADNVPDLPRPNGGAGRVFDFPLDLSQAPAASRQAGVVQGFYLANRFHDRLYALGFNEVAGNFQASNFGRGGVGGDAIQLDCFDGSGTNNANFNGSGVDGTSGRIQMYVWTGPNPDRDGCLDSTLVFHEFTHGLSRRLVGTLDNLGQSGALGEGWSDFFGLSLSVNPASDPNGTYPFAGYVGLGFSSAAFTSNNYFGLRRFPYSTSFGRNPLTLGDIDPRLIAFPPGVPVSPAMAGLASEAGEVHNAGEVWCTALWQARGLAYARLGPAANNTMMQISVDGMKLLPGNPTFLQARDTLLAADLVRNAGANAGAIWSGFAIRGMGIGASVPSAGITSGVVEDFATPQTVVWSYPDGLPGPSPSGQGTTLRVTAAPVGLELVPGTVTLHVAINDGAFTATLAEPTGVPGEYRVTIPGAPCGSVVRYYVSVGTSAGEQADPPGAPAQSRRVAGGSDSLFLSDDFEQDRGWTMERGTAGEGFWVRADPAGYTNVGQLVQPSDDHTPGAGTQCFVTGANFFQQLTYGHTSLVSPAIDLSGNLDAQISYWRWYVNGAGLQPYQNVFTVEASDDNGASWRTAEVVGPGSAHDPNVNPGWRFASWRLSTLGLTPSATVRVRFTAENAFGASFIFAAVDDLEVTRTRCVLRCGADFNQDGELNADDLGDFITCFFLVPPCTGSDFNQSGTVDADDLGDYITAYFQGCR